MTKKELQSQFNGLLREQKESMKMEIDKQTKRWDMLKNYLKVREEEYAEIENEEYTNTWGETFKTGRTVAVKKTRLVPIKK